MTKEESILFFQNKRQKAKEKMKNWEPLIIEQRKSNDGGDVFVKEFLYDENTKRISVLLSDNFKIN